MNKKDKLQIEQIRKAANTLLDHLEAGGVHEVRLEKDYYWEIDSKELYDVENDPKDLGIGSLSDDWQSVQRIASGQDEPLVLLLLKVAPLLRYIADAVTEAQLNLPEHGA